jgi:hypothetical protein
MNCHGVWFFLFLETLKSNLVSKVLKLLCSYLFLCNNHKMGTKLLFDRLTIWLELSYGHKGVGF